MWLECLWADLCLVYIFNHGGVNQPPLDDFVEIVEAMHLKVLNAGHRLLQLSNQQKHAVNLVHVYLNFLSQLS